MTDKTAFEKGVEMKDKAFDVADQLTTFINAHCDDSNVVFLGLSLVVANMISHSVDQDRTRQFFEGALTAALKDIALNKERQAATVQ